MPLHNGYTAIQHSVLGDISFKLYNLLRIQGSYPLLET
jgi:hypothetical protein